MVNSMFGTIDPMYNTEFVITIVRPVTEKLSMELLLTSVQVPSQRFEFDDITRFESEKKLENVSVVELQSGVVHTIEIGLPESSALAPLKQRLEPFPTTTELPVSDVIKLRHVYVGDETLKTSSHSEHGENDG